MPIKLKYIAIVATGTILVSILYLYITRNSPVIYRYRDRASVEQSAFIIQNPFRERGPEDEAVKILQALKDGNCRGALAMTAADPQSVNDTCEREGRYRIQDWSIIDRTDIGNQVVFVFQVHREQLGDNVAPSEQFFSGLAWVDVEKIGEDRWRTLSYQTYY